MVPGGVSRWLTAGTVRALTRIELHHLCTPERLAHHITHVIIQLRSGLFGPRSVWIRECWSVEACNPAGPCWPESCLGLLWLESRLALSYSDKGPRAFTGTGLKLPLVAPDNNIARDLAAIRTSGEVADVVSSGTLIFKYTTNYCHSARDQVTKPVAVWAPSFFWSEAPPPAPSAPWCQIDICPTPYPSLRSWDLCTLNRALEAGVESWPPPLSSEVAR